MQLKHTDRFADGLAVEVEREHKKLSFAEIKQTPEYLTPNRVSQTTAAEIMRRNDGFFGSTYYKYRGGIFR